MTKVHYQRVPLQSGALKRLAEYARRVIPKGSYHVPLSAVRAVGGGDIGVGEEILAQMFRMAAPRSIHPDAISALGFGSVTKGRKVLQKFFDRAHEQYTETENAKLPADQQNEPETDGAKAGYYYERVPLAKLIEQPDGHHGRAP